MKYNCLHISFLLLFIINCCAHADINTKETQSSLVTQATFDNCRRLLLLDGDEGTVACRVYGSLMSGTIPRFSENWNLESATRSFLRMKNLTAVRGIPGSSMVGPIDYFGNLETPDQYLYTIKTNFPPLFYKSPMPNKPYEEEILSGELKRDFVTIIKSDWISGKENLLIKEKEAEYSVEKKHLRQSLFRNPGILEIDRNVIELNYFDPRGIDLSSFKARLVNNEIPFQITKQKLAPKDEFRIVTYLYEPLYSNWQTEHGSGLFLEKHQFSQTMTPLTVHSKGFVVLARTNENEDELELIAVCIPYGYTLIIEEDCIHGDTTLNGFFMMGMTSDHTTMRTANTVFLKHPSTKENVKIVLTESNQPTDSNELLQTEWAPYVIYKGATKSERERFKSLTKGRNFIFNPFSREFWK